MNIRILKTNEIDKNTWVSITEGFNETFSRSKTSEEFISYYGNSALNYSYHALAFDDTGVLAGSTTIIPHYYIVNGEKVLFGLSGGTFVKKEFRTDIFVYQDMVEALRFYCREDGIKVFYGVSNNNSFKYALKFLGVTHLMDLSYYALPVKLGSVLKSKSKTIINSLSFVAANIAVNLNYLLSKLISSREQQPPVQIDFNEHFISYRFKKGYKIERNGNLLWIYKIVVEDGVQTAYLIEYREKGKRTNYALSNAIKHIIKKESFDLILYIGTINHKQSILYKLPSKKEPKRLPVTYEILGVCSETFLITLAKKENWDFGLVNFDVR